FLYAVRLRKGVVVTTLLISSVLGALYYLTAPRLYDSDAQLLVLKASQDPLEDSLTIQQGVQNYMPTYRKILTSDKVLASAIENLPKEHRIDLKGVPRENWIQKIRENTSVTSPSWTNLIDIRYRSLDPYAAAAVVDAIVRSYLAFMDKTHKNNTMELLNRLTAEKNRLEGELHAKEEELLRLRTASEAFVGSDGESHIPALERVFDLNKKLTEIQEEVIRAQAFYDSVQRAIQNGEDIEALALQEIEVIGREFLMQELGLGREDTYALAQAQIQLNADKAKLRNLLSLYGERHPRVLDLAGKIRMTEEWLGSRQLAISQTLRDIRNRELKPRLLQMA
ncbi:MAG TPA: hypothetical protein EYP14_03710, partial [Planctomycetaceae bacterium]|nr:hypothetical protein [Planctomycetaceae bacterium]